MKSFLLRSIRSRPGRDASLRLSMAGSRCARDLFYAASGAPAEDASNERRMKMAIGTALDELALGTAGHEEGSVRAETHVPISVTMGDLTVDGTADLVLYGRKGPLLVSDLKVVGEETWKRTAKKPQEEHSAKANLHAYAIGSPRWSVCYVRAATGEMREHFGKTDAFAARRDFGSFEEAAYWLRIGTPPPRPFERPSDFPCRFCPHQTFCWQEETTHDRISKAN